MITVIGAFFFYKLARHNVYLSFLIVWLCAHIGVAWLAKNFLNRFFTQQIRVALFVGATLICIVFVGIAKVPFTVMSIGVRTVPTSVEFVMVPYGDEAVLVAYGDKAAERPWSFYASRGSKNVNVEFVMPTAMQDSRKPSEIYFGSQPRSYDIYRISYGSEFLFWRIPIASFEGADLMKVIGVDHQNALTMTGSDARLSSKINSKPKLQIKFNQFLLIQKAGRLRRAMFILLWLCVFVLISAATIWGDWAKTRIFRLPVMLNVNNRT